ncbi:hypothetical protein BDW74DRAFT_182782 [Aspergillus multicolor]|uniref:uncharacterized protein n=1 Tax=Aspergillus multicolor TaxID=41759 RepID=UPI003CCCD0FA
MPRFSAFDAWPPIKGWNENIARHGDTTIIVPIDYETSIITEGHILGPGQHEAARFRVSSYDLILACPASFGKIFRTPQILNQRLLDRHVEYTVSPYDPIAYATCLTILHEGPLITRATKPDYVLKLAILALHHGGTYDAEIKKHVVTCFSHGMVLQDTIEDRMKAIWTTILLDMEEHFRLCTIDVIHSVTGHITAFGMPIPEKIISDLNSWREIKIRTAVSMLYQAYENVMTKDWRARGGQFLRQRHLRDRHASRPDEVRFLVFATDLKSCSPFFKKALDNDWKEAVEYSDNGAVEFTTTGWDPQAFLLLMRLFHWKKTHVAENGSFTVDPELPELPDANIELTAKLVVLADYYQCHDLLKLFYADEPDEHIAPEPVTDADSEELRYQMMYLLIAWAFEWPTYFTLLSWNVILTLRRITNYVRKHHDSYRGKAMCPDLKCQYSRLGMLSHFMMNNGIFAGIGNFTGVSVHALKEAAFSMEDWTLRGHVCDRYRANLTSSEIFSQKDFPGVVRGLNIDKF